MHTIQYKFNPILHQSLPLSRYLNQHHIQTHRRHRIKHLEHPRQFQQTTIRPILLLPQMNVFIIHNNIDQRLREST
jgi:hypothetical protein